MMKSLFILGLFLTLLGCDQTKNNWNKAKQSNSIAEVKKFLEENPNSEFDVSAKNLLDSIEWVNALNSNDIGGFKSYIANFPNSKNKENARNILQQLLADSVFAILTKSITIESLESFIKEYPDAKQIGKAKQLLHDHLILNIVPDCVFFCGHVSDMPNIGVWYGSLTFDMWMNLQTPNPKLSKIIVIVASNKGMKIKLEPGKAYLWRGQDDFVFIKDVDTKLRTTEIYRQVGLKNMGANALGKIPF